MSNSEEYERAVLESAALERALSKVHSGSTVQTTPESIRNGNESIAAAYAQAPAQFQQRIDNKQLMTAGEFCDALGVNVDWLDGALQDGRVFALTSPSGRSYYPAFYADVDLVRADLERVATLLSNLPPLSQYTFFYRNWTQLGAKSPLEALRDGGLENVARTAEGFVQEATTTTIR